jgi:hypothetical protein
MPEIEATVTDESLNAAKKMAFKDRMTAGKQAKAAEKADVTGIHWFGEVDMNLRTGKPGADYPTYYFKPKVRELENELRSMERQLEDGMHTGKELRKFKAQYLLKKDRLDAIHASRPNLEGPVKDKVNRSRMALGNLIKGSMFTYSSMNRMTDDPQIEADRMEGYCIEIKDPVVAEFVNQRGFPVVKGKITRNAASVIHKVMGDVLGAEILDIEDLRGPDIDRRGRKSF